MMDVMGGGRRDEGGAPIAGRDGRRIAPGRPWGDAQNLVLSDAHYQANPTP